MGKRAKKTIGNSPFPEVPDTGAAAVAAFVLIGGALFALGYFAGREAAVARVAESAPPDPAALEAAQELPVVEVLDGHTLTVKRGGRVRRVRLLHVLAPGYADRGGKEASAALRGLVEGAKVRLRHERPGLERESPDGAIQAYVFVDGLNVNVEMVRLGWSRFETGDGLGRYPYDFVQAERDAERRKAGMWDVFSRLDVSSP